MKNRCASVFLSIIMIFSFMTEAHAFDFPVDPNKNNKFGIHILDESDLPDAASLVNSNGGKWGYITFVIREDERDTARWSRAFKQMADLHLIPIVRIATKQSSGLWEKPSADTSVSWADFL